jgi:hypothetical protein
MSSRLGSHRLTLTCLALAAVGLLTAVHAPAASAASKSCVRGHATFVSGDGFVRVVRMSRHPHGSETRRDVLLACWTPTGRRFRLFTERDFGEDLIERSEWVVLAGRYLGVHRQFEGGVSESFSAQTFDVKKRKRLQSTRQCNGVSTGDASGIDDVAFLNGGGLAYSCNRLWLATAKGEVQLEPPGTVVRNLAVALNSPYVPRLYWTVESGTTTTVKSLPLP